MDAWGLEVAAPTGRGIKGKLKYLIPLVILGSVLNCFNGRGRFAFALADHQDLPVLEKYYFQPQRFVRPDTKPIFERDEVLWYAYKPFSANAGKFYAISLQKKSLGYQEVDLRNRTLVDGVGLLIDHYKSLEEGEYRLKVAYNNKVIDQIDFIVVGDSASESIDYEKDEDTEV